MALNVALYGKDRNSWSMTERGERDLVRTQNSMQIGGSSIVYVDGGLEIVFDETALPWPGHRLMPSRMSGRIRLEPQIQNNRVFDLDPEGHHIWWPVFPRARVTVESNHLPDGGWQGEAYHDFNFGDRVLEEDFEHWDWARGPSGDRATTVLYDAVLRSGTRRTLGLVFSNEAEERHFAPPDRQMLPVGSWGVKGGIACDPGGAPRLSMKLEDAPFYRRSLVETMVNGDQLAMVHETLDCKRLANPVVRMMLPFRMPRRTSR
ncbi:MAG: carotenoid 1,2-hydratase [Labrenzia sp.]